MEKRVFICYWHLTKFSMTPWQHGEEVQYTEMFYIVEKIMRLGYNIMILQGEETITIMIDDGLFRQS